MTRGTLFLMKDSNDVLSHCQCDEAFVALPEQGDCPWCGCGWLFTCQTCRMAFTFARLVHVNHSLFELARNDLLYRGELQPEKEEIHEWVDHMQDLLAEAEEGQRYVHIDGLIVDTAAAGVAQVGIYAEHDLIRVPQVEAASDLASLQETLADPSYWFARCHAVDEVDEEEEVV